MVKHMKHLIELLTFVYKSSPDKTIQLGRWSLKNCKSSHATTFYANRDHCGDTLCKVPKKYDDKVYNDISIEKKKTKTMHYE